MAGRPGDRKDQAHGGVQEGKKKGLYPLESQAIKSFSLRGESFWDSLLTGVIRAKILASFETE